MFIVNVVSRQNVWLLSIRMHECEWQNRRPGVRLQGVLSIHTNVYMNLERGRAHSGNEAATQQGAQILGP